MFIDLSFLALWIVFVECQYFSRMSSFAKDEFWLDDARHVADSERDAGVPVQNVSGLDRRHTVQVGHFVWNVVLRHLLDPVQMDLANKEYSQAVDKV